MKDINTIIQKLDINYLEDNYEALLAGLYPARREAILRFRNKKAAYISLGAGLLLQEVIKAECGIFPKDLQITSGTYGKPYIVTNEDFKFNLSHSGNYVAIAYGECNMGIDIELIREREIAVAKKCFTSEEYNYVLNGYTDGSSGTLRSDNTNERFFQIWTMKESYLKCTGTGISIPLNSFYVNPCSLAVENTDYRFYIHQSDEYTMALCTSEPANIHYKSAPGY